MIIACPICETGFNLPIERITAKGVKLRCSKCGHVFRVRNINEQGPEIFYKEGEAPKPPEPAPEPAPEVPAFDGVKGTQIGLGGYDKKIGAQIDAALKKVKSPEIEGRTGETIELRQDYFGDDFGLDEMSLGNESSIELGSFELNDTPESKKKITDDISRMPGFMPSFDEPSAQEDVEEMSSTAMPEDEAEAIFNNLTQLSAPSEPKLDLFDDVSGFEGDDPFEGAFTQDSKEFDPFTEFSTAQEDAIKAAEEVPILAVGQPGLSYASEVQVSAQAAAQQGPKEVPRVLESTTQDSDDFWKGGSGSMFGDTDDMVDPNFGAEEEYFDANTGKQTLEMSQQSNQAPAVRPVARPATQAAPIAKAAAPKAQAAPANPGDVTSPHQIGGSGAQKAANLLLIILLVGVSFVGLVTMLNDGAVDFKNFGHMLEVAFSGKTYQPRAAWRQSSSSPTTKPKTSTPDAKGAPELTPDVAKFEIKHVTLERVRVNRRVTVLVIRGKVHNTSDKQVTGARVTAKIYDSEEANKKLVKEGQVLVGKPLGLKQLKKAKTLEKMHKLYSTVPIAIDGESALEFTMVLDPPDDLPKDAPVYYDITAKLAP